MKGAQLYVRKSWLKSMRFNNACPHCGRWSAESKACVIVSCLACGSPQCHGNGGARGTCAICHVGVLPGWSGSDRKCGYKGCSERGIAEAARVGRTCKGHASRAKSSRAETVQAYVLRMTEARDREWQLVTSSAEHAIKTWFGD